jgi:hypothetical protein
MLLLNLVRLDLLELTVAAYHLRRLPWLAFLSAVAAGIRRRLPYLTRACQPKYMASN